MAEILLNASIRDTKTKGELNSLRKEGYVPGVIYSKGSEAISVLVKEVSVNKMVFSANAMVGIVKIDDKEEIKCIVKDIQFDPVTDKILHFDFYKLTEGEPVQMEIPVELKGSAEGVRKGGKLQKGVKKLKVEVLPEYIQDKLTIDISKLNVGKSIHVRDVNFENVKQLYPGEVMICAVKTARGVVLETEEE